ncbi:MAG TPA: PAS domain-containing protein, partial [Acidimicrobiales bacterium]|nr:PAS domain-containing protein [Acidimicrobiales bacterium]
MTEGSFAPGPSATRDGLGSGGGLFFDANPSAMWVHDAETLRFLAVNEAAVRQYGWSRTELLSMTVLDVLPPEDRPAFLEELLAGPPARFAAAGPVAPVAGVPTRRRHHTRDGAVLAVDVQSEVLSYADRRATLTLARDVTERDQLQAALDTTGDQLREAQAVAKVGIWDWDVVTDQVRWSEELYRIFGVTPQIFPGTFEGYMAVVHPDDRAALEATVERSLRTLEPFDIAHRAVRPDGATRWLQCGGRVRAVDGRPVQMTGACQDVTAQREAAEALSKLALHDPLTALPNRSLFMDRLGQA